MYSWLHGKTAAHPRVHFSQHTCRGTLEPHAGSSQSLCSAFRFPIIKAVRPLLSTEETLWLYEGQQVPAVSDLPATEAYEVAFCLMAQAVSTSNPRALEQPLRHLQSLNSTPP